MRMGRKNVRVFTEQIDVFEVALAGLIAEQLVTRITPHVGCYVDYHPDRMLQTALERAGITESASAFLFPLKSRTTATFDEVEMAFGYRAESVVLARTKRAEIRARFNDALLARLRASESNGGRRDYATYDLARQRTNNLVARMMRTPEGDVDRLVARMLAFVDDWGGNDWPTMIVAEDEAWR